MKKILIVDDESGIRELLNVTLSFDTYQLLEARNGAEALRMARQEKPDLIVLDVMLAGSEFDGLEVCRQLKADKETRHSFVLMLTAKDQKRDRKQGLAAGADDYVVKPFSPVALMAKVDRILETAPAG